MEDRTSYAGSDAVAPAPKASTGSGLEFTKGLTLVGS